MKEERQRKRGGALGPRDQTHKRQAAKAAGAPTLPVKQEKKKKKGRTQKDLPLSPHKGSKRNKKTKWSSTDSDTMMTDDLTLESEERQPRAQPTRSQPRRSAKARAASAIQGVGADKENDTNSLSLF